MNKREFTIILCKFIGLFAFLQASFQFVGALTSIPTLLSLINRPRMPLYAMDETGFVLRVLLPVFYCLVYLSIGVTFWFFSRRVAQFILRDVDDNIPASPATLVDWQAVAFATLGIYLAIASVHATGSAFVELYQRYPTVVYYMREFRLIGALAFFVGGLLLTIFSRPLARCVIRFNKN